MTTTNKVTLRSFLQAWYDWAIDESRSYDVFSTTRALCVSAVDYCKSQGIRLENTDFKNKLPPLFVQSGLCSIYPFGRDNYESFLDNGVVHLDKNRLSWVKAYLDNDLENWKFDEAYNWTQHEYDRSKHEKANKTAS